MVTYAVVCTHCGSTVLTTAHVDDPELVLLSAHLHAEHPGALGNGRRSEFKDIIRHFRLTMA
jgi:hypothetical protein